MTKQMFVAVVLCGVVLCASALAQDGIVSIDHVTGSITPQTLYASPAHVVSIRYNLLANEPPGIFPPYYWVGSNGFEIYSPDGADWNYFEASDGPLFLQLGPTVVRYRRYFVFDGSTWSLSGDYGQDPPGGSSGPASRAGFHLGTAEFASQDGYVGGEDNDIALYLEFGSNLADDGLTLCLDSCASFVAWEWTKGSEDYPLWDNGLGVNGPRCWEIHKCPNCCPGWCAETVGNITFSYCGQAQYHLCAIADPACWPDMTYRLAPPYDNGNYGTVDPESGLWTWSGPTVPQTGSLSIEFLVSYQGFDYPERFVLHVTVAATGCDCCEGRVGDANHSGEDEPTISDVSALIDHLFISRVGFDCYREADINQSGGLDPYTDDITISDVSMLIDYLFITGQQGMTLPECP